MENKEKEKVRHPNIKWGPRIVFLAMAIYVVENMYFGWNEEPHSMAELIADLVVTIMLWAGFTVYIIPAFKMYEYIVNKYMTKND